MIKKQSQQIDMAAFCTRFAPSPTGPLHLGHAYSALLGFEMAQAKGGKFFLRIEDIDQSRARPSWEAQIYDDLRWLGLSWETPVMRQSDRQPAYDTALDHLWAQGLLYPCSCRRKDILTALDAPQEGAPMGPDGVIYPGTCRGNARTGPRPADAVLRIDMAMAMAQIGGLLTYQETGTNPGQKHYDTALMVNTIGDVVLARRDMGTSYHLSVVVDDAEQHITDVVRGEDLQDATPIHVLLQNLLGFPSLDFSHHSLIRDNHGKRLAKRDDARAISVYRAEGRSPADIRQMIGL